MLCEGLLAGCLLTVNWFVAAIRWSAAACQQDGSAFRERLGVCISSAAARGHWLTPRWQETCKAAAICPILRPFSQYFAVTRILSKYWTLTHWQQLGTVIFAFFQSKSLLAAKKDLSLSFKLRIFLLKCSVQIIDIFAGTSAWSDIAPHKPHHAPNSAQSYLASGSRMEDGGEMSGEKISLGR